MMNAKRAASRETLRSPVGVGLTRAASLLAITVACAACAAPLQSGEITVAPGAAQRLDALCRWGGGEHAGEDLCSAQEEGGERRDGDRQADRYPLVVNAPVVMH